MFKWFWTIFSLGAPEPLQDHDAWVNLITDITRYTTHLSLAHAAIKDNIKKPWKNHLLNTSKNEKTYTDKIQNLNFQTTLFCVGLLSVGSDCQSKSQVC